MATTPSQRTHRFEGDWLLAGLNAGAGLIHIAATLEHRGADALLPIGFAVVAWAQLAAAYLVLRAKPSRSLLGAVAVGNLVALGFWVASRTVGLPFDLHGGVAEPAARLDIVAAVLGGRRRRRGRGRPARWAATLSRARSGWPAPAPCSAWPRSP